MKSLFILARTVTFIHVFGPQFNWPYVVYTTLRDQNDVFIGFLVLNVLLPNLLQSDA
jgi:hypothetical protein